MDSGFLPTADWRKSTRSNGAQSNCVQATPGVLIDPATWRKSTRSGGGSGNCVEVAAGELDPCTWRKSTDSGGGNGNCVEVAGGTLVIGVRDTKDRDGGILVFDRHAWTRFLASVTG